MHSILKLDCIYISIAHTLTGTFYFSYIDLSLICINNLLLLIMIHADH